MSSEQEVPLLGPSCREASRLISESLDRELTRRERWSLRMHTLLCIACQHFAKQTALIRAALANVPASLRDSWSQGTTKLSAERRTQIKLLLAEARRSESLD